MFPIHFVGNLPRTKKKKKIKTLSRYDRAIVRQILSGDYKTNRDFSSPLEKSAISCVTARIYPGNSRLSVTPELFRTPPPSAIFPYTMSPFEPLLYNRANSVLRLDAYLMQSPSTKGGNALGFTGICQTTEVIPGGFPTYCFRPHDF